MTNLLRTRPVSTTAMMEAFSDASTIAHALAFEAALAEAQEREGVIPAGSASAIAAVCDDPRLDGPTLADEVAHAGTLAIPLVARLRSALPRNVRDHVHRGATSQDVADTALMLQIRNGVTLLLADSNRTIAALDDLARAHAETPAIGRTLLQDALPIGYGLRFAQWSTGIAAAAARLRYEADRGAALQFGGPAGTRAGLDGRGEAVAGRMATRLGLRAAPPWHARRDAPVAIGAAVGLFVGALGKMARDVSLLAQNAIGELGEPTKPGRGGSSAMAHKRNPTGCQVALSAATRTPGLVATLLAAMPQEQERGLGGWQSEGPALADLFLLAAGAAAAMADVAEGLVLDPAAIERNLASAAVGNDVGETAVIVRQLLDLHRGEA